MSHIRTRVFAKIRAAIFKNLFDIVAFSRFVLLCMCVCVIPIIVEFKAVSLKSGKISHPLVGQCVFECTLVVYAWRGFLPK